MNYNAALRLIGAVILALLIFTVLYRSHDQLNLRRQKARVEASQLAMSIMSYRSDYHEWPRVTGTNNAELMRVLAGDNPKHIIYTEFSPKVIEEQWRFPDPWGHTYHVETQTDRVRVWSYGPDGRDDHGKADDVTSWDN